MLTARDLTDDDRRRLNGDVQRVLQKGADDAERLLGEVRRLVAAGVGARSGTAGPAELTASGGRGGHRGTGGGAGRPGGRSGRMARLLLVEDNEANRDMLCRRLQRRGHEVLLAADGQQGLDLALAERPAGPTTRSPPGTNRSGTPPTRWPPCSWPSRDRRARARGELAPRPRRRLSNTPWRTRETAGAGRPRRLRR